MNELHRFKNFTAFYAFYLGEHSKRGTRIAHFCGALAGLGALTAAIVTGKAWLVLLGLAAGYGLSWYSHFFIERNRPATFKYPLWSLTADFVLFTDLLRGKEKFG